MQYYSSIVRSSKSALINSSQQKEEIVMKGLHILLGILCCVSLFLLPGCNKTAAPSSSSPAAPSPSPLSAAQVLSQGSQKMEAANSFHFVLDHTGGGTPIAMGIEMTKAVGDLVKPDKLKTVINGTALSMSIQVQVITIGDATYMTNPLNGKWELLPNDFQVLSVFDPASGVAAIMKGMANTVRLSDEDLQGTACYHVRGDIDSGQLNSISGSSVQGIAIKAEVWIAKDDFLPRLVKLAGKITEGEKEGIVRSLSFSDYNQAVKIEKPL
jgi:lipoprotein LprG